MVKYDVMLYGEVEKVIGYSFRDRSLLETALTHSSYANDFLGSAQKGNERLEFLGDAILDAVVGLELYNRFPEKDEGFLTRLRAEIVCEKSLGEAAMEMGLNQFLRLGKGEAQKGGRERLSIASDAAEAVIAAVFLDGGPGEAAHLVDRMLGSTIEAAENGTVIRDYKTELQIRCQQDKHNNIKYEIIDESGPDHDKTFTAAVYVDGKLLGTGVGHNKKLAQAQAAAQALKNMEDTGAL